MILERANQIPPFMCRIMARKGRGMKPLSNADIAGISGLNHAYVSQLSLKRSWTGIRMDVADRFARACGVDLTRPAPHLRWLRMAGMKHLREGNAHQRRFFKRLFELGKQSRSAE